MIKIGQPRPQGHLLLVFNVLLNWLIAALIVGAVLEVFTSLRGSDMGTAAWLISAPITLVLYLYVNRKADMNLFHRNPPAWKDHLRLTVIQPAGLGGLWFYELAGKDPYSKWYTQQSPKGFGHPVEARVAGEIMAGRVYGDAAKKGIMWARLDAPPQPVRTDWRQWMSVAVGQAGHTDGLWHYQIAWKGADGALNRQHSDQGYEYESAARETGENLAAFLYDRLVEQGVIPTSLSLSTGVSR